jgi:hypothetical protein
MATQDDGARYLTLPEVAERYRTTIPVVRYWRHTGFGPRGVKVGVRVLYPISEIRRFDAELARQAADVPAGR